MQDCTSYPRVKHNRCLQNPEAQAHAPSKHSGSFPPNRKHPGDGHRPNPMHTGTIRPPEHRGDRLPSAEQGGGFTKGGRPGAGCRGCCFEQPRLVCLSVMGAQGSNHGTLQGQPAARAKDCRLGAPTYPKARSADLPRKITSCGQSFSGRCASRPRPPRSFSESPASDWSARSR